MARVDSRKRQGAAVTRVASESSLPAPLNPGQGRRGRFLIPGIFLIALLVRLIGIQWGLPEVFEEAYPLKIAARMAGLEGGDFTLNPRFFHYPSLMIYAHLVVIGLVRVGLLVAGAAPDLASLRASYASDPTAFYVAARTLTALFGALMVLPVYAIGRCACGPSGAWVAAMLVAFSPALIAKSQMVDVDVPLAFMVTWALALAIDLADRSEPRLLARAAWAGAAVGLAASTKYPGVLAILPILVALGLRARRAQLRAVLLEAFAAILAAALVFIATSPYLLLDRATALDDLTGESIHQRLGHFGSQQGATWVYYSRAWFADAFGWIVGGLAALGLAHFGMVRKERWAIVLVAFALPLLVVVSASAVKADRYLMPVIPAGSVFTATLILHLMDRLPNRRVLIPVGLMLVGLAVLTDLPRWKGLLNRSGPDPRTVANEWIARSIPAGSMLVIEPYGPWPPSPLNPTGGTDDTPGPDSSTSSTDRLYWVVPLPIFQVRPERTAVYYAPELYANADIWIVTGATRDRYRREPLRFAVQCTFYDWLDRNWVELRRFRPGSTGGSEIVIYRNPSQQIPFGSRIGPPPAPTAFMQATGGVAGEAAFYFALGHNYLGFGRAGEAAQCFRIALSFPVQSGGVTRAQLENALQRSLDAIERPSSSGRGVGL